MNNGEVFSTIHSIACSPAVIGVGLRVQCNITKLNQTLNYPRMEGLIFKL